STAKQLHGLFQYKGYKTLESFVLRARDGQGGNTSGVIPGNPEASYDFRYGTAVVSGGAPRVVQINRLELSVRTPTSERDKEGRIRYESSSINTNIDVREGQKVVVGKSTFHGSNDALILVVTAKVVE